MPHATDAVSDSSDQPPRADGLPPSVSTIAAARRLSVTVPTIQRWMDQGVLRGWKTAGGHRRIEVASLEAIVQQRLEGLGRRPSDIDVLLVDDNPLDRELLNGLLRDELPTMLVRTAADGFEALTEVARKVPHLIVTDVRMPFMDGVEMVRHLLTGNPQLRGRILITSVGNGEELRGLGELRAHVRFAHKPVSATALHEALAQILA